MSIQIDHAASVAASKFRPADRTNVSIVFHGLFERNPVYDETGSNVEFSGGMQKSNEHIF